MPMISEAQLARVQGALVSARESGRRLATRVKESEKTAEIVKVTEMVGGAAAFGFLHGKMEDPTTHEWVIPGTTADVGLVVGMGLAGAGLFDLLGEYDNDAINVGGGILAHMAGQMFRKLGSSGNFGFVAGTPILGGRPIIGHQHGDVEGSSDVQRALDALAAR